MSLFSEGRMKFKGYEITHNRETSEITFTKDGKVRYTIWRFTPYDNDIKRQCDMLEGEIVPKSRRLGDVVRVDGSICKGETRY